MKTIRLAQIAQWTEGRLMGEDCEISTVHIDSRVAQSGGLFVALRGERFDAHDFISQAKANGAAALLVHHPVETDLPYVLCADTHEALGEIAAGVASARTGIVLALTGSNGKTSVKTLLHSILQQAGNVYANPGNRNNEIGLPLAVLECPENAQFAVYEMGAGKPGDIAYLTSIVSPNVALVNNIAPAHIERMGSLLGIAETKAAIYEALPDDGMAVVNVDDAFAPYFMQRIANRACIRFGLENNADVCANQMQLGTESSHFELQTPAGKADIHLQFSGQHNVLNALAATAMALAAGAPFSAIVAGLHSARPVAGRQAVLTLNNGAIVIDDSYNANPGSVSVAIESLASACAMDGKQAILVLGDMAELGEGALQWHAQIGSLAKAHKIQYLFTCGKLSAACTESFGDGAQHFSEQDALIHAVQSQVHVNVRVLIKGSRSSAMDRVVNSLRTQFGLQENSDAA